MRDAGGVWPDIWAIQQTSGHWVAVRRTTDGYQHGNGQQSTSGDIIPVPKEIVVWINEYERETYAHPTRASADYAAATGRNNPRLNLHRVVLNESTRVK